MISKLSFIQRAALLLTTVLTLLFGVFTTCFSADLLLFAGAGMRRPTDHLVKVFQEETGHRVRVNYGGSGQLLSSILASGQGDLFMPGAFFYIQKLEKAGRISSEKKLVAHTAVVGVNIHKTGLIRTFDDLAKPGLRLAMGDPKAMAFGRVARKILSRSSLEEVILNNVVVYGATVKQLALYVAEGDVDAAIIGRADAFQFKDRIQMVKIPSRYFHPETVAIAVLKGSEYPKVAMLFCDFLASKRGMAVFKKFGFLALPSGEPQKGKP
jgi:molybdate transport system substrate-binding protein